MEEVIRLFNQNDVRYLVFGGQAVRLEGMPRFSMDLIASKEAAERPQDQVDLEFLRLKMKEP